MDIIRKLRYRYIALLMVISTLLMFCLGMVYVFSFPVHVDIDIPMICLLYPDGDGCKSCVNVGEAPGNLCERCENSALENLEFNDDISAECIAQDLEWPEYPAPIDNSKWYETISPVLLILIGAAICMNVLLSFIAIIKFIDNQQMKKAKP